MFHTSWVHLDIRLFPFAVIRYSFLVPFDFLKPPLSKNPVCDFPLLCIVFLLAARPPRQTQSPSFSYTVSLSFNNFSVSIWHYDPSAELSLKHVHWMLPPLSQFSRLAKFTPDSFSAGPKTFSL